MYADADRFLRLPEILSLTGFSRATIYRKMSDGTFPERVQISSNCVAWHDRDIVKWKAAPIAWKLEAMRPAPPVGECYHAGI
jgi:prophage regulatory protein